MVSRKTTFHRTTVNIWSDVWEQIENLRAKERPIPTRSAMVDKLLRCALSHPLYIEVERESLHTHQTEGKP